MDMAVLADLKKEITMSGLLVLRQKCRTRNLPDNRSLAMAVLTLLETVIEPGSS